MQGTKKQTLLVTLLLVTFAAIAVGSLCVKSMTSDEIVHLPAGLSYWKTGDFRLNPEHPPLLKMVAAFPLLFSSAELPLDHSSWKAAATDASAQWEFGREFFFGVNRQDASFLLILGRLPMVLLGVMLGLFLFLLGRGLFSPGAGLATLVLYTFSPTFLAHTRLVTTDVGLVAFFVASLYHYHGFLRAGKSRHLGTAGIFMGLALAAKYSAVLLFPTYGLITLVVFLRGGATRETQTPEVNHSMKRRVLSACTSLALMFGIACTVAALAFGGNPAAYLRGAGQVFANHDPEYHYYLLGRFSETGFWYYYFVAMAVKTALPILLLAAAGFLFLAGTIRKPGRFSPAGGWLLMIPFTVMMTAACMNGNNIGVRHVLMLYPTLFLLGGFALTRLAQRGKLLRLSAGFLVVWLVATSALSFPHYISYFNEALAAGSTRGLEVLDDSNVEWGQDLRGLGVFVQENDIDSIALNVCAPTPAGFYGIPAREMRSQETFLPCSGWYAIGAHVLVRDRVYRTSGHRFHWLDTFKEVARIGDSIYVYRFLILEEGTPPPPGFTGTVMTKKEWLNTAIRWYWEALAHSPCDPDMNYELALVLVNAGRRDEAATCLEWAEGDNPTAERLLGLGGLYMDVGMPEAAVFRLERSVRQKPSFGLGHVNLAAAYLRLSRKGGPDQEKYIENARASFKTANSLGATGALTFENLERKIQQEKS